MQLDDKHDDNNDHYFDSLLSLKFLQSNKEFLLKKEFTYVMSLLDEKISVLYRLCRFISNKQQKNIILIQKLVAIDELYDNF